VCPVLVTGTPDGHRQDEHGGATVSANGTLFVLVYNGVLVLISNAGPQTSLPRSSTRSEPKTSAYKPPRSAMRWNRPRPMSLPVAYVPRTSRNVYLILCCGFVLLHRLGDAGGKDCRADRRVEAVVRSQRRNGVADVACWKR
jgi:hypothetical protein